MRDYIDLFNAHDEAVSREWDKIVSDRPICACCGEAIMDDSCIEVDDECFCNDLHCKRVGMEAVYEFYKSDVTRRIA